MTNTHLNFKDQCISKSASADQLHRVASKAGIQLGEFSSLKRHGRTPEPSETDEHYLSRTCRQTAVLTAGCRFKMLVLPSPIIRGELGPPRCPQPQRGLRPSAPPDSPHPRVRTGKRRTSSTQSDFGHDTVYVDFALEERLAFFL